MKKIIPILFLHFILGGCVKSNVDCTSKTVQSEQAQILAFAASNGVTATAHSSGLYYQIVNQGSGPTPSLTSKIFVTYTGQLMNGTTFDSKTNVSFMMNTVIPGWQTGLPLIQKGGAIKLIVPSSMAYGCHGFGTVPADAVLYFEITLLDVQ